MPISPEQAERIRAALAMLMERGGSAFRPEQEPGREERYRRLSEMPDIGGLDLDTILGGQRAQQLNITPTTIGALLAAQQAIEPQVTMPEPGGTGMKPSGGKFADLLRSLEEP